VALTPQNAPRRHCERPDAPKIATNSVLRDLGALPHRRRARTERVRDRQK
jgi:hypothetical protein